MFMLMRRSRKRGCERDGSWVGSWINQCGAGSLPSASRNMIYANQPPKSSRLHTHAAPRPQGQRAARASIRSARRAGRVNRRNPTPAITRQRYLRRGWWWCPAAAAAALLGFMLATHSGQYHSPSGSALSPTHSKWNHSMVQSGLSQPTMLPAEGLLHMQ